MKFFDKVLLFIIGVIFTGLLAVSTVPFEPQSKPEPKWEAVYSNLERIQVPGGWIYRAGNPTGTGPITFVPRPKE